MIWENKYGCEEQNLYETSFYLMVILSHLFIIFIEIEIIAPGHVKYVFDGLN